MKVFKTIFAIAFLFSLSMAAIAQANTETKQIIKYINRADQREIVVGKISGEWKRLEESCETYKVKAPAIAIQIPPVFDADGTPTAGQWSMRVIAEGCDKSRIINVAYGRTPQGKINAIATLPGDTKADVLLQRKAIHRAMVAVHDVAPKTCRRLKSIYTRFGSYDDDTNDHGPWTEDWTLKVCDIPYIVPIHFIPDAKGTLAVISAVRAE